MLTDAVMYNKRTPLIKVRFDGDSIAAVTDVFNSMLLPISLQTEKGVPDLQKLNEWLEKRRIPDNRDGLRYTMANFPNFSLAAGNRFSLSDQYWFQFDPSEKWDDLNFFTNRYGDETGKAFFSPWLMEHTQTFSPSPDFTTNGALRKTWKQQDDLSSHLVKAGSRKLHQEPITEVLASAMLKKMNLLPFVTYTLTIEGMTMCSECRNFVDKDTEFVPAAHIYFREKRKEPVSIYHHLLRMCDKFEIEGAQQYIDSMITADHIIGNDDRHLGNFGFLRDAVTGKILGFAPLFDSGSAYGGKTNHVNRLKLFDQQKDAAVKRNIRRLREESFFDHDELFELISIYPDINRKQRDFIKNHILKTEHEVRKKMARTVSLAKPPGPER